MSFGKSSGPNHGSTRMMGHRRRSLGIALQVGCLLCGWSSAPAPATAFSIHGRVGGLALDRLRIRSPSALHMAKAAKKKKTKKKGSGGGGGGLKGFGSVGGSKRDEQVDLDRSKEARSFYGFMEDGGAGDNLSRCAIGGFPVGTGEKAFRLRGVAALKPVKKGDAIVNIPYELAVNLGREGADPTVPAVAFLRDYCETLGSGGGSGDRAAYYSMLPPFGGADCLGSTDFFSDLALEELQAPLVAEETRTRRKKTSSRFLSDVAPLVETGGFPSWTDGSDVTEDHLAWAVWLVTSRVLTVQGEASEGNSYRLLIPFLDMCNHDRGSPHVLSGRSVPGGELKVVAGAPVKEGDQVNICYGGGMVGNDRFLQDYGFLDTSSNGVAYDMVAQQLLGKRRIVEGIGSGRFMSESDRARTLDRLGETSLEDDERLLEETSDPSLAAAYSYRIGVKKALSRLGRSD